MVKILIINEGYSDNLGDQAILESTILYFRNLGYKTEFLYLSNPLISKLPQYNYLDNKAYLLPSKRPLFRIKVLLYVFYWFFKHKNAIISKLKYGQYDFISFGGGQLINSSSTKYPSQFSIALYWIAKLIIKFSPNSKIFFLAVGAAKSFNFLEKFFFKKVLDCSVAIWVRDEFSQTTLRNVFNKDSILMPDIAFFTDFKNSVEDVKKENLALVGIANYDEVVAKYSPDLTQEQYYNSIISQIKSYQKDGIQVKMFYTTKPDVQSLRLFNDFLNRNGEKEIEICAIQNLSDLIEYIKKAKYIFSGRMHALILGLKYGCEVKSYLLSQKLISFDKAYVQNYIDIKEINKEIMLQSQAIKALL